MLNGQEHQCWQGRNSSRSSYQTERVVTALLLFYAVTLTYLDLYTSASREQPKKFQEVRTTGKILGSSDKNNNSAALRAPREDMPVVDAQGPTLCTRYLALSTGNASSLKLSPTEQELRLVLLPHCQRRPFLLLEDYLPDLDFFKPIALAMQAGHSSIRALIAGRGTTGTHTLQNDWARHMGFSTLHWRYIHNCQGEPAVSDCISRTVGGMIDGTRKSVPKKLYDRTDVSYQEYKTVLLGPFANGLATLFGTCGHCRYPFVIGDNPYTYMFTELYFASGPDTRVVLSRRDALEWSQRRQSEHGKEQLCLPPWQPRQDPFSPAQCTSRRLSSVARVSLNEVRKAYEHYEAYIHQLVPGNFLLDLNLFTSSVLDNSTVRANTTSIRDQWTNALKNVYRDFLGAP